MGVYIYQNNSELAMKNAYIGEYQEGWQPGANTIAYWSFNDTLDDGSGNGHTLTASGSYSYIDGVSGKCGHKGQNAMAFTVANLTDTQAFSGNFTLMFFIRLTQIDIVERIFGAFVVEAGNYDYTNIQYESGQGGLQWYNNDNNGRTSWSWTPTANKRYHIAITGDGSSYTAYLDGVSMTKTKSGTVGTYGQGLMLGNNCNTQDGYGMHGDLDEVIIENKIWTQAEVQTYLSQFAY